MAKRVIAGLAGTAALLSTVIPTGSAQQSTPPKARYVMDVSTTSGFGANTNVMAMAFGGGRNAEAHALELRLGSTLAPNPAPAKADHFMPAGMKLGASVPLATPDPARPAPEQRDDPRDPSKFQRPKGRMLLFWGCGAKAGPGQPIVIDFSKLAQGQIPPNLFTTSVPADRGPSLSNSRTYGYWPNTLGKRASLPKDGSLIGDHRIAGTYSPEIKFALSQDFMPALHLQTAELGSGATDLSWNSVAGATGYYAHGIGFSGGGPNDARDIIWWTSSARKEFGGGLWDWLPPAVVQRLIGEKVVMPPSQTQCVIPAEVKAAGAAMMMLSLYGYGPEANFAYPPRPANPKVVWTPEWTVKVRYRATTSSFLGMPGMGASAGQDTPEQPRKRCKPSLGSVLGGVLAGGSGC